MPVPPPESRSSQPARAVLGVCLLASVVLGLHLLVPPALAAPDLGAPGSWLDWASSRSPVLVAMALVRVAALALAWYLLAVTALQVIAVLTDAGWLGSLARVITPTMARHLATAMVGAGVMAATPMASGPGAAFANTSGPATAAAAPLPAGVRGSVDLPRAATSPPSLRRLPNPTPTPDPAVSPTTPPRLRRAPPSAGPTTPAPADTPSGDPTTSQPAPSATSPSPPGPTSTPPVDPAPRPSPGTDHDRVTDVPDPSPDDPTANHPDDPPRLVRVPSPAPDETPTSTREESNETMTGPDEPATAEATGAAAAETADRSSGADADQATTAPDGEPTVNVDASEATTWTVVAGDHFWGVAEREVARHLGRVPTEDEVATWWRRLVEVNRDRLVDRDNPDLILPGQVMRFPAPTSEAG
ncbi:LysM peptidoglycan-binding domain-containing protein [Salsipaludibacter albus]|uniref:LysM peptidoglycan-binding domain-containing protein n=1 Tax=Salsipaludibacter albus TaxID=2849650 RepID=UPI001EE4E8F3|nr:hypothetical protein [Salsipaludibacter albus]MBY5163112.1 hypothetical protein [Salsipaludibacter albus]